MIDSTSSDIREYADSDRRPPILHKDESMTANLPGKGRAHVGYRGPVPARRVYGYVQFCTRRDHFHRNEEGYALSEKVLRKLRTVGCRLVLIAEEDTGIVYEFHERQFREQVSKRNNPKHDEDPQRKVKVVNNRGKWHDHARHVLTGER